MKVSIKVTEGQKEHLFGMKRPGEDFSDVIGRLLSLHELVMKAEPIIRGRQDYQAWLEHEKPPPAAERR